MRAWIWTEDGKGEENDMEGWMSVKQAVIDDKYCGAFYVQFGLQ